ncbi:MAG: hypothetical protein ACOZCL_10800 [Bacillota bacterium]
MKPRIIVLSKRNLMIYTAILLMLIIGLMVFFALRAESSGVPSSGYTYLKFKDGIYIGTEKTDYGNIKAEVTIANTKIKEIKLLEFPPKFIEENGALKDEIPQLIYEVIQKQNVVSPSASTNSAYVLNKIAKAIRTALDQSLLNA